MIFCISCVIAMPLTTLALQMLCFGTSSCGLWCISHKLCISHRNLSTSWWQELEILLIKGAESGAGTGCQNDSGRQSETLPSFQTLKKFTLQAVLASFSVCLQPANWPAGHGKQRLFHNDDPGHFAIGNPQRIAGFSTRSVGGRWLIPVVLCRWLHWAWKRS